MVRRRGDERGLVTLLLTDIVGSGDVASELGDERWYQLQARHHAAVRKQLKRYGGHEVDTAGDGFFITFSSPTQGVRCAFAIVRGLRDLGLDVRAGIHIGEAQLTGEKVGGIAVTTAARVSALADPGQVLATDTIVHLVAGAGFAFTDLGSRELKGVPGRWELFSLDAVDGESIGPPLDPADARRSWDRWSPPDSSSRRGRVVPLGAAAVVAVIVLGAVWLGRPGSAPTTTPSTSGPALREIAALNATTGDESFPVDLPPRSQIGSYVTGSIVFTGRPPTAFAWVPAGNPGCCLGLAQINRTTGSVIPGDGQWFFGTKWTTCICVAWAEGRLWTPVSTASKLEVPTRTPGIALRGLHLEDRSTRDLELDPALLPQDITGVVATGRYLWVGESAHDRIYRVDLRSSRVIRIALHQSPDVMTTGDGSLWALDTTQNELTRVDPSTGLAQPAVSVPGALQAIAVGGGYVWLTDSSGNTIQRISEDLGSAATPIPVGQIATSPSAIAYDEGELVVGFTGGAISRINPSDPTSPAVIWKRLIGNNARSVGIDEGVLWVAGAPTRTPF